jgi:hypothetical protein
VARSCSAGLPVSLPPGVAPEPPASLVRPGGRLSRGGGGVLPGGELFLPLSSPPLPLSLLSSSPRSSPSGGQDPATEVSVGVSVAGRENRDFALMGWGLRWNATKAVGFAEMPL